MGTDNPRIHVDGEGPKRNVSLSSFYIDKFEVTNDQFQLFVKNTSYITESENFGWSFVFDSAVSPATRSRVTQAVLGAEWWLPVEEAYWYQPEGPHTDVFQSKRVSL